MPTRGPVPDGAPIWLDVATDDVDRTIDFYSRLFGWEHESFGPAAGGYGRFHRDGRSIAGVGPTMPGRPATWGVYLRTSDADASAAAVREAGGTVLDGPQELPGSGRFVACVDPAGAAFDFWEPGGSDGFALTGEHGTPVWFETWSSDYDAAVTFYARAAGWPATTMADTPEFRYTTYGEGAASLAGIFDARSFLAGTGGTSTWVVYLGADDVDALAARAVELGGTTDAEFRDTPYGRQIGVADPQGTRFQLNSV